jgi:16S rRNA (adenine1518-N6/adenine1519-N6)-dimethyltransferase
LPVERAGMVRDDDFSSPKRILDARHLRPRKRFGQNFLTDARIAERIATALPAHAYVVEIGGGTGTLTDALLRHARAVTTLELDRDLATVLHERFAGAGNRLRVVTGDVLQFDLRADLRLQATPRAICGNLPYYITTPIIERIFESGDAWQCAVLMVQREYARRLTARAGTPEYGSLSVFAAHYAHIEKLFDVGAAGFYPAPDVASSVVRLTPQPERGSSARDEQILLWLIRAAFAHRRKTLVNSVLERAGEEAGSLRKVVESAVAQAGLSPSVRGERLTLADFCALASALKQQGRMERLWTTLHPINS